VYANFSRGNGTALNDVFYLRNHDAAAVMNGRGDLQLGTDETFLLDRDVAVLVGIGAADQTDVQREGGIEEVLLSADFHQLHHAAILKTGPLIDLASAVARVGKGVQTYMGQNAGLVSGDSPEQMHDNTQRERVCSELVAGGHGADLGGVPQVGGNDGVDQTLLGNAIHAKIVLGVIAGAHAGYNGEICWMLRFVISARQGVQQCIRAAVRAKTACRDGCPVGDKRNGFLWCNDFNHNGYSPF
jgi:hypothetical protein